MSTQLVATVVTASHRYERARVELGTDVAYIRDEKGRLLEQIDGLVSKDGRNAWSLGESARILGVCAACSSGRPTKVRAL